MRVDSISGHESPPTIHSFASTDSMNKSKQSNILESGYGKSSIISYKDQPLSIPGEDSVVKSLSVTASTTTTPETTKGYLDTFSSYAQSAFDKIGNTIKSIYDTTYTYFWGVSPYANANAASEAAMSEMQRKRISDAIDAMIKALERIQEVLKEEGADETASEDRKRLFSFIEILKNDAIIIKKQLANNAEAISILQKDTRDNLKKIRTARENMHDAAASTAIANGFANVSSVFAVLAGIFNTVELLGYISVQAPVVLAARAGALAALGTSSAAKLAKTTFDKKRIEQELIIDGVKQENQKNDTQVKNLSQDIGTLNQNMPIPESLITELEKETNALINSLLDYK